MNNIKFEAVYIISTTCLVYISNIIITFYTKCTIVLMLNIPKITI